MRQRTVATVRLWPNEPHWTAVSFRHFDISRGVWRFWGKNCKFKVLVLNLKLLNFCYYLAQSTAHWCHLGRSCSRWDRCRGRRLAGPSFEWSTPTWCPHWGWSQSGRSGCPRSPERAPCPWTSWWWLVWKMIGLISGFELSKKPSFTTTYLSPTALHLILASRPRCTVSVRNLVSKWAATGDY